MAITPFKSTDAFNMANFNSRIEEAEPIGSIKYSLEDISDEQWHACDGTILPANEYTELFANAHLGGI